MGIFDKFKKKAKKTKEEITKYQDAIAFAEEGRHEEATQFLEENRKDFQIQPKLLVIGHGNTFSSTVIEYSIDMAKRLGYEIVALNTASIGDGLPVKSLERKKLRQEFLDACEKNIQGFKNRVKKEGLNFSHKVKFLDKEDALEEIKNEIQGIEFVISDTERDFVVAQDENREKQRPAVCVYSMV